MGGTIRSRLGSPYRGYELKEITLVPRPLNMPVECWQPVVSASPRGLDFMARHGIKALISGGWSAAGVNADAVTAWRDALARNGRETEPGGDMAAGFYFHIADTEKEAITEARRFFEENLKFSAPLGILQGLTDQQVRDIEDPRRALGAGLPTVEDAVRARAWFCGPPEKIIERIHELEDRYPGLEQVNAYNAIGTPEKVIVEQLEWFGREVIPAFKGRHVGQVRSRGKQ